MHDKDYFIMSHTVLMGKASRNAESVRQG
jgi:hypothetical protein